MNTDEQQLRLKLTRMAICFYNLILRSQNKCSAAVTPVSGSSGLDGSRMIAGRFFHVRLIFK